ncbi:WSSV272 [White spot syndrome virus]|uniref:WSSV272 n=1 Tax=White spot syndrome virus TaxID=342409 RepID=A0A2I6SBZ8_9VIRU|nr:WSSV272 [White spot syndrome virus]
MLTLELLPIEKLVLASSYSDSFVYNYKDAVVTAEAPKWCPLTSQLFMSTS